MTATPRVRYGRPLAQVARTAGARMRVRRSLLLAGGGWLATAAARVGAQLQEQTGPTRSSGVLVVSYPPLAAATTLQHVGHVDDVELAGARLAAEADAAGGQPRLWLFIASCQVLWNQAPPAVVGSLS